MRCGGKTLLVRYLFLDIFPPPPPFQLSSAAPEEWSMLMIQDVHLSVYDTVYVLLTIKYISLSYNLCLLCLLCNKHIVTYKLSASKSRKKETHTHISFIYNFSSKKRYFFEEGGGACFWNFLFQNLIFIYIYEETFRNSRNVLQDNKEK